MESIGITGQKLGIKILATLLLDKVTGGKKIGFDEITQTMEEALQEIK